MYALALRYSNNDPDHTACYSHCDGRDILHDSKTTYSTEWKTTRMTRWQERPKTRCRDHLIRRCVAKNSQETGYLFGLCNVMVLQYRGIAFY